MKRILVFQLCSGFVALVLFTSALSGCASTGSHNTKSLLSAAGFRTVTPITPEQQTFFEALPPYRVERGEEDGKVVYAYADKKRGLLFLGGENEYQRFRQLGIQQRIANQQLQAAQMNANASMMWGWGPPGYAWW